MTKDTFNINYAPTPGAYLNQPITGEGTTGKERSWRLRPGHNGDSEKIPLIGAGILWAPHSVLR